MADNIRLFGFHVPIPRIVIALVCTLLHLCFGTVYAWSYFQVLLVQYLDWTFTDTALSFGIAIFALGCSAAWAGTVLPRWGPRKLAMAGSIMFVSGFFIASYALVINNLLLFNLGYGVVGGIGLGFGYVTPVATVANWFPDRKGLATGVVVMGFGMGALLLSKLLAPVLFVYTEEDLPNVFLWLGIVFGCILIPASFFVDNPVKDDTETSAGDAAGTERFEDDERDYVRRCLKTPEFAIMWTIFFFNIVAGISIISIQSPLLQEVWNLSDPSLDPVTLAEYGATLIAVSSVCNGLGRLFWGLLSDVIGRVMVFRILLASQTVVFGILMTERDPWIFSALVCYVLLCFGGGFATMPSFITDVFGAKKMSAIYGVSLTAWAMAGILGPLFLGYLKDMYPDRVVIYCFLTGVLLLTTGFIFSMLLTSGRIRLQTPTVETTLMTFDIPAPATK